MAKKKDDPQSDVQAQLAAIVAQLGQAAAPAKTVPPLGVPANFKPLPNTTNRARPVAAADYMGPVALPALYDESDVFAPASKASEVIIGLQASLAKAGLLKSKYRYGIWDPPTQNAYRQALELANQVGVTDEQAITMYANAPQVGAETERAPLVKRLPNPDDLRDTFTAAARSLLGHKADPGLIQRMVDSYSNAVAAEQQQEYDLAGGTGGTVTQTPDPSTFAEQQIRRERPAEAGAHDAVGVYSDFLDLWGSNA